MLRVSSSSFAVVVVLLASTGCKERNPAFVGPGTSSGTDATDTADPSSTGGPTSNSTTLTTTPDPTMDPTMDPTVETTVDPTEGTGTGTDPTTGTGSAESTGGDVSYPACEFGAQPECPDGYDDCVAIPDGNWCTVFCDDPSTCPQPTSGTATVECAGPGGNQCALACDGGAACPDGMQCVQINGNIDRCVWP